MRRLVLCATSGGVDVASLGQQDWRPEYRAAFFDAPDWFIVDRTDLTARLSTLGAPTLVVHGDRDPPSAPCGWRGSSPSTSPARRTLVSPVAITWWHAIAPRKWRRSSADTSRAHRRRPAARLPVRRTGEVVEEWGGRFDERRAQALEQPSRPRLVEIAAEEPAARDRSVLGLESPAQIDPGFVDPCLARSHDLSMTTRDTAHAALYHRVSTLDQDPTLARRELRAAAARLGLRPTVQVEETCSGARNDRPGLRRVMEAARRGEVEAVLVWKLDRFGRSALNVLATLHRPVEAASSSVDSWTTLPSSP